MGEIEKIDLMSFEQKYLIDYSNIKDGIIKNQNDKGVDRPLLCEPKTQRITASKQPNLIKLVD